MKDTIEETKEMLESHYEETTTDAKFVDVIDELVEIVIGQLHLPHAEAYRFVISWFDNRH